MKIKNVFSYPIFYLFFLLLLILYTFWKLPQTFYQQDEWLGLGQIWAQGWSHVIYGFSPVQILFGDGRPLTRVFGVIFFGNFPFNSLFLSLYSIGLHFINTILVFFIASKILKKPWLAFIASAFFSINSVTHQSVTWFGASFGTQPASLLIFLSIYFFLCFLENNKNKFLHLSLLSALISLYFKESSIFLFVFFPLIEIMYRQNFSLKEYTKKYLPFIAFITLFIIFRLYEMMVVRANFSDILAGKVYANIGNQYLFPSLIVRSIMYPLTSLSLIFIPISVSLFFAELLRKIYYPFITLRIDQLRETVILDMVSIISSFVLLFLLYYVWNKYKKARLPILFSLSLFILSILPYMVISKTFGYLEPRYYYISSAAAGMILSLVLLYLFKIINSSILKLTISLLFIFLIFSHIKTIKNDINHQIIIANERKSFISQLYNIVPTLNSDKNIFYIDGSQPRFSKNKAPFQNGVGYTLMVLYYKNGVIPSKLLSEGYLWDWDKEGYRQVNGKGFGYFYDKNHLKDFIIKNKLDPQMVIALYYDSSKQKLKNITDITRKQLSSSSLN